MSEAIVVETPSEAITAIAEIVENLAENQSN